MYYLVLLLVYSSVSQIPDSRPLASCKKPNRNPLKGRKSAKQAVTMVWNCL